MTDDLIAYGKDVPDIGHDLGKLARLMENELSILREKTQELANSCYGQFADRASAESEGVAGAQLRIARIAHKYGVTIASAAERIHALDRKYG
jgi:hypothetical protein